MKEFVEKLIGGLEKRIDILKHNREVFDKEQMLTQYAMCEAEIVAFEEVVEIVNQLAEECNNNVCEWSKQGGYNLYLHKTSCGAEDTFDDSYVYCPYCGKKIKVVE